jgi:uncharacterized protein YjiK
MEIIKNRMQFIFIYQILFLVIISCDSYPQKTDSGPDTASINAIGYDLNNPDEKMVLPPVLHEISGITAVDSSIIACIQDEHGIIFFYDVRGKALKQQITFYGKGDFEGITRVNETFYVLKSNGTLYEVTDTEGSDLAGEIRLKGINHKDFEGLCYDRKENRLLIAPKDRAEKDSKANVKQGLYGFDLSSGELLKDPLMEFNLPVIKDFAISNKVFGIVEYNKKGKPGKPDISFMPSAIAVHPVSGKLYLLSAHDHMLFVFSLEGTIEYMVRLKPDLFNMAEGITFFENGDMLVSNEGQRGMPSLLKFSYQSNRGK